MILHLLPGWALKWVLLHGLTQKLEALKGDLNVLRPGPGSLLDLAIEKLKCHLIGCLLGHVENEHSCQHLVENYTDGPDINLVAIS